ncbi:uncharacterized protein CANTADRAFT_279745 [Suhomyces tanzawaensis NRRL Y-17324]|uniref:Uncharacterized protein n=1 Tax=Suhomyces tanzawaensis NRRL Y-17324 TaxID=984487 RepID=A0A1E4SE90_9ASCO|nr:uncharacterized protein CANTADRAFT_279745 [Suhomyces tanzawaensis NRRL Y-17324]ODV77712.1 hypothetical protein CANTADRAFT_279745 [Suhomyces tanzawaensis NRRL Y-17324]
MSNRTQTCALMSPPGLRNLSPLVNSGFPTGCHPIYILSSQPIHRRKVCLASLYPAVCITPPSSSCEPLSIGSGNFW